MKNRGFDREFFGLILLLSLMGVMALSCLDESSGILKRQIIWILLGAAAAWGIGRVDSTKIFRYAPWIYGAGIFLLLMVLFFPAIRGAKSWISLGPLRLQPAELAKPCVILALAAFLGDADRLKSPWRTILTAGAIAGLPMGLVLCQPDVGTSLTFVAIFSAAVYAAGLPTKFIFLAVIAFAVAGGRTVFGVADRELLLFENAAWRILIHEPISGALAIGAISFAVIALSRRLGGKRRSILEPLLIAAVVLTSYSASFALEDHLKDHHRKRLLVFVEPDFDPRGASYNVHQSLVAIGSGGIFGKGVSDASQIRLGFLPEWHTDFIFAAIAEIFGFVGAGGVLVGFAVLLRELTRAGRRTRVRREMVLYGSMAALIGFHLFINVGMVLGLVPVIGIPLPFVSYGGSATLGFWMLVGLHQSCYRRRAMVCAREESERERSGSFAISSMIFSGAKR